MKYTFKIILLLVFSSFLFAETTEKPSIFIASINKVGQANEISAHKIYSGMKLAIAISQKYSTFSQEYRDSILYSLSSDSAMVTAYDAGKAANADWLMFLSCGKFNNMLRIETKLINMADSSKRLSGIGYDLINFRAEDSTLIADPSILKASQRSFAAAFNDSLMYENAPGKFKVFPGKSLAIGGIEFIENPKYTKWDLYDKKIINSYYAIETMFEEIHQNDGFIPYDIETRDSIFAYFRLMIPENYTKPTTEELDALSHFGVESFITGNIRRIDSGAELNLMLYLFRRGNLIEINSVKGIILEDNIEEFRDEIEKLTKELLSLK